METKLRHRVVGALVLAALAIIFLPLFFKGSSTNSNAPQQVTITEQIPPAPAKPTAANLNEETQNSINTNDQSNHMNADSQATTNTSSENTPATTTSANQSAIPNAQAVQQNENVFASNQPNTAVAATTSTENTMDRSIAASAQQQATTTTTPVIPATPPEQQVAASNQERTIHSSPSEMASVTAPTKQSEEMQPAIPSIEAPTRPKVAKANKHTSDQDMTFAKDMSAAEEKILAVKPTKPETTVHVKESVAEEETVVTTHKNKPQAGAVSGWIVQLGSFSTEANAKALEKRLKDHGFAAYLQKIKTSKGMMTRVVIGPETQRIKADLMRDKLDKQMQLKAVVVPFESHVG